MRVLVGCETSGLVRRAFARRGHDVWSCDILPAEDGSNRHIRCDIRDILGDGWDLLAVMHPPCTRLCRAGGHWLYGAGKSHPKRLPRGRTWPDMIAEFEAGCALFSACWQASVARVVIENPVMHVHAAERLPADLPKPQIVQPWWFGDPFFKATGLYARGLPPLSPTDRLVPPARGSADYKAWSAIHRAPPGPDRWRLRSRTFPGLADAIAGQYGAFAARVAA